MRPGIFSHRYVDFGNYQQCIDTVDDENKFEGRYSLIQVIISDTKVTGNGELENLISRGFVTAICYPSTCSKSDIDQVFEFFNAKLGIKINSLTSETKWSSLPYSTPKVVSALVLLSLIGFTHFSSTLCFYFKEEDMPKIVRSFNSGSAWQRLTSDTSSELGRRLEFFNGIRVLYLIGAICVHLYLPIQPMLSAMYLPEAEYFDQNPGAAAIARLSVVPSTIVFVIG